MYVQVTLLHRLLGEVNIPLGEVSRSKSSDTSYTLKAKDGSQSKVVHPAVEWIHYKSCNTDGLPFSMVLLCNLK